MFFGIKACIILRFSPSMCRVHVLLSMWGGVGRGGVGWGGVESQARPAARPPHFFEIVGGVWEMLLGSWCGVGWGGVGLGWWDPSISGKPEADQRGRSGVGRLGSWEVGKLGTWEVGELGSWGAGELGSWGAGELV